MPLADVQDCGAKGGGASPPLEPAAQFTPQSILTRMKGQTGPCASSWRKYSGGRRAARAAGDWPPCPTPAKAMRP